MTSFQKIVTTNLGTAGPGPLPLFVFALGDVCEGMCLCLKEYSYVHLTANAEILYTSSCKLRHPSVAYPTHTKHPHQTPYIAHRHPTHP